MTDVTDGRLSRWKTFGERTIYDSPWVWLGQVDVKLPDEQDRVLLLWRHRFVQDQWGGRFRAA